MTVVSDSRQERVVWDLNFPSFPAGAQIPISRFLGVISRSFCYISTNNLTKKIVYLYIQQVKKLTFYGSSNNCHLIQNQLFQNILLIIN